MSAVVLAFALATPGVASRPPARAQERPPNILVIVTDDQRAGETMSVMPQTLKYFASEGIDFPNAIATTPVCCPSRASIFTGKYAHNHDVRSNADSEAHNLDQGTTVQHYLQEKAFYRTGIVGKYLNGWNINEPPPNFDEYAITRGGYYKGRFGVGVDGVQKVRRDFGYSTNFVRRRSTRFIQRAESNDDQPWLLYVTPFAPHNPSDPPLRYLRARVPPFELNPAMVEEDLSDKPPQYLEYATPFDRSFQGLRRRRMLRTLMPVDEMVHRLMKTLNRTEESNTLVFFMSDNGFMWGEHGLSAKATPYDPSISIPLMMRWEGRLTPSRDERLAANIDIAPTIMDATDVEPDADMDGRSLLQPWERTSILTEVYGAISRPELRWASVLAPDYQYVEYYGGDETVTRFREYYDLTTDPWQLENLLGDDDTSNDPNTASLSA
ncbi:MAG TPA: sulfatase, partial [Actinomycetota bacterium]|nr:sulfatase [Actinomycetota bacterium]